MKRCRITIRQVVSSETFGLVPAGRNRKNNMNYVVTILTEKYLYRVNIEGGIKYTLGSGKKDLFPMSELGIDGQLGMCFNEKKQVLKLTAKTIPLSVKEINEEARLVHICGYPKMEVSFTRDTGEYPESYAIPYECQIHIGRSKKNDIVLNEVLCEQKSPAYHSRKRQNPNRGSGEYIWHLSEWKSREKSNAEIRG